MYPTRTRRTGVTLIETIMVIVLLAAAAIASSILLDGKWVAKRNVAGVTNDIAETLGGARNTAIINQATVRVRRIRRGGIEQLVVSEDAGPFSSGRTRTFELGGDVRVGGAPRQIRFNPTGAANRALRWTVSQSRITGQVNVAPADGQVTRSLP